MNDVNCKYCQSERVIKFGKYKNTQYYYCKACRRKFSAFDTIPKMQTPIRCLADVLNMYYEGLTEAEIRRNLIQQEGRYPSTGSIYGWVHRFTDLAVKEAVKHKPNVGDAWVADETVVDIDGKNVWLWDIIDVKTRFLIASRMSFTRTTKDAEALMRLAYERTGKAPRVIYTDKLRAYLDGIELTFGADTKHRQGGPFDIERNTNVIERFHGTIKSRTKVMRGLHTIETARMFLDGWLVHYNFFRPHLALKDKTPAEVAQISFPFRNWKDVCEQPYEVTARIPILAIDRPLPKARKTRAPRARKVRMPRVSVPTVTLSRMRG
ncbi:MAG: IS6 family transposase [Chloroflexota bacterium]